jgi:hypothetical protein
MYCTACGKENPDGARYCCACGKLMHEGGRITPASPAPERNDQRPADDGALSPLVDVSREGTSSMEASCTPSTGAEEAGEASRHEPVNSAEPTLTEATSFGEVVPRSEADTGVEAAAISDARFRVGAWLMVASGFLMLSVLVLASSLKIQLPDQTKTQLSGGAIWDLITAFGLRKRTEGWRKFAIVRGLLGLLFGGSLLFSQATPTVTTLGQGVCGLVFSTAFLAILFNPPSRGRIRLGVAGATIAWVFLVGSSFLPPYLALLTERKQIRAFSLPDRIIENRQRGYRVTLPDGWKVLSRDNPILKPPEDGLVLADLDDKCLAMFLIKTDPNSSDPSAAMARRLSRKDGEVTEVAVENVQFMGRSGARLARSFKDESGAPYKGYWTVVKSGWNYFVLWGWYPERSEQRAGPALLRLQEGFALVRPFADVASEGMDLPAFTPREALYPLLVRVDEDNLTAAEYAALTSRAATEGLALLSASEQKTNTEIYMRAFGTLAQNERKVVSAYYAALAKGTVDSALQAQGVALVRRAVGGLSPEDQALLGKISAAAVRAWLDSHPSGGRKTTP